MKNIEFGQFLQKLLHTSNQKKSSLARELGYDASYISKWINGKTLPSQRSIDMVCKSISKYSFEFLKEKSSEELESYIGIDRYKIDTEGLQECIELALKESYEITLRKQLSYENNNSDVEDINNSITHVSPKLKMQYLSKDFKKYTAKASKLDIIISANIFNLNNDNKKIITNIKKDIQESWDINNVKAKFLIGFKRNNKNFTFDTMMILNIITMYPDMKFEIYNCDIDSNSIICIIKDRMFHCATYAQDGRCLFTNTSKDKQIIDQMYHSLNDISKNQGKSILEKKSTEEIIKEKTYIQYIMGQDLRILIGTINELFMPDDLFIEIGKCVFGDDENILRELKQMNAFLQDVTYISKIKILIHEEELRKYISFGELSFFNIPIKLNIEQRERHIKHIEKVLKNSESLELRLIEGNVVDYFKEYKEPTLYLSKHIKLTKSYGGNSQNNYILITDNELKSLCDDLFEELWENRKDIVIDGREIILERISKKLAYVKILNESYNK